MFIQRDSRETLNHRCFMKKKRPLKMSHRFQGELSLGRLLREVRTQSYVAGVCVGAVLLLGAHSSLSLHRTRIKRVCLSHCTPSPFDAMLTHAQSDGQVQPRWRCKPPCPLGENLDSSLLRQHGDLRLCIQNFRQSFCSK